MCKKHNKRKVVFVLSLSVNVFCLLLFLMGYMAYNGYMLIMNCFTVNLKDGNLGVHLKGV